MANFYEDNEDLRWYVERGIDWEPLVRLTEHDFTAEDGHADTAEAVSFYQEVLGLVGEYAADAIAPRWRELDAAHPHVVKGEVEEAAVMTEVFEGLGELGVHGLCIPRELGGMNAPLLLLQIDNELLCRADVSVGAHHGFHGGIAMAALAYSLEEGSTTFTQDPPTITATRFSECIEQIAAGEAWGSMDITEPDAGSDMAALRSTGTLGEDGIWRVSGQKIYITSGHGRWHFVIARTEPDEGKTEGLKGLSMFLVPAFDADGVRTHTTIDGCETKLGHNGSATVAISFEDAPAMLVGERGDGFKHMLVLMNNARVGVGFESIGLSEAAYRAAVAYAQQRPSMGKTIDQHEMIAEMLEDMRTEIQAMRAMAMTAGWHEEMAQKIKLKLTLQPPASDDEAAALRKQISRHSWTARKLTPLLKWYSAEQAVDIARRGIQIHGGAGYTRDYPAEKLLRDAMVFPIYEGTTQIQALMAMKDALVGVIKNPRRFVSELASARWSSLSETDALARRVAGLRLTSLRAIAFLLTRLAGGKVTALTSGGALFNTPIAQLQKQLTDIDPKRDFALAMLHADRLASLLTDAAVADLLLDQRTKDADREDLLVRWLDRAEPRSRFTYDELTTRGTALLERLATQQADRDSTAEAAK